MIWIVLGVCALGCLLSGLAILETRKVGKDMDSVCMDDEDFQALLRSIRRGKK